MFLSTLPEFITSLT